MANLIDITLLSEHRVLGKSQAIDAQCRIHQGVADDLIKRGIAKLTKDDTTKAKSKSGGGK